MIHRFPCPLCRDTLALEAASDVLMAVRTRTTGAFHCPGAGGAHLFHAVDEAEPRSYVILLQAGTVASVEVSKP